MNTRRRLLVVLGTAASIPRAVFAQSKKPLVVIGWFSLGSRKVGTRSLEAFKEGLAALGWKEGAQYVIEVRCADGQAERGSRPWVEDGALLSYGVDNQANYRRAAWYVDRILKGAKPGDLPIEQPMNFEVAVNLKTAKALGLTIPPAIMVRATHVIQ